ncbi:TlyA family RNA methyltransferase [Amphiplicatus metriothermophilus]|uniref:23S rRNA (Cytidine1920-2'-O)/16S rRNA (Cytidine1409-2'-O)-methyltransferase n=1 Tax=Amphiplicatus metriothermophilus TaxID=1519374 RepID=A0A239PIE2_9PROT|nr:TlyA family RNA methyltransferase [Amphiplicatus metriothermophilus]MBB5518118.1 23S rRNA (cytidine1920-2'-O)/16S rRNA (cytidine1409-2'-O)-methyltransferase [Amphiplicatus metriothermophilus]SNT67548.1 23S rRNA (cytidine1920-2'-O)/16S rRNA (cytidine1409-2'-O)-methyltransferase [Amphiplicatus metriothermophilus]
MRVDSNQPRRLDLALVEAGHFESRVRAQAAIRAGLVRVGGVVATRPSSRVTPADRVEVAGDVHDYVSRGGVKLEAALGAFGISPAGEVCLDLGASTGGFTDALLRAGARRVYAVDVGTGQLHASLAGDRRVVNLEKTHAKDLTRALVPEPVGVLVCDLSFISIRKALAPALALAAPGARAAVLVKPQFELGPEKIGKGGRVKAAPAEIEAMLADIAAWFEERGWTVEGVVESPIAGGDGNREFLLGARKKD